MEVIIRWVVDYLLTSSPVWRGTLPLLSSSNSLSFLHYILDSVSQVEVEPFRQSPFAKFVGIHIT